VQQLYFFWSVGEGLFSIHKLLHDMEAPNGRETLSMTDSNASLYSLRSCGRKPGGKKKDYVAREGARNPPIPPTVHTGSQAPVSCKAALQESSKQRAGQAM